MTSKTLNLVRFFPLLGWAAVICVLSVTPSPPTIDMSFFSWDKFQHAGAYALFTLLAGYALLPWFRPAVTWWSAAAAAVLYGGLMEIAQGVLSAVRAPEWGDLAADALGAVLIVLGALISSGRRKPETR